MKRSRRTPFAPDHLCWFIVLIQVACGGSEAPAEGSAGGTHVDSGGSPGSGGVGGSAGGGGGTSSGGFGGTPSSGGAGTGGSGAPTALPPRAIVGTRRGMCALDESGAIHCWGSSSLRPEGWQVPPGPFAALFGSFEMVCGVRQDGLASCFWEPLGTDSPIDHVPEQPVQTLAITRGVICGIDLAGDTFCNWSVPVGITVPSGERFKDISTGPHFGCGIREADGSILCWGSPGVAEDCSISPDEGQLNAPHGSFVSLHSRGAYSTCAIAEDGSVACWGAGEANDDPTRLFCEVPVNFGQSVPPSGTFRSVTVGTYHSCGIRTDGTVACWGAGTHANDCANGGQDCGQSLPPPGQFEQVALGDLFTCGMKADRTIECWGWDGDGDGRTVPPEVFR